MKKAIVALMIILVCALAFHKYQEQSEIKVISIAMRDASARVSTMLEIMRGGKGVSYAEFISMADTHNAAIDNSVIMLKSQSGAKHPEDINHAIYYLEKCQSVIRAASNVSRSLIATSVAKKSLEGAIDKLQNFVDDPTNDMQRAQAKYVDTSSVSRQATAANEQLESSTRELGISMKTLSEAAQQPRSKIPIDAYIKKEDLRYIVLKVK